MKIDVPFKTPGHKTKSHAVYTVVKGKVKLIRFGQQGVIGVKNKQDKKSVKIRQAFFNRHKKNILRGKSSAAFWSNKVKWGGDKLLKLERVGKLWGHFQNTFYYLELW